MSLAHRCEDLLGALRDGRFGVRRDLVDLLLAATEGIGRAMPGADRPVERPTTSPRWRPRSTAPWTARTRSRSRGWRSRSPDGRRRPATAAEPAPSRHGRRGETVRVPTRRVHDLLDVVGEAELEARRLERTVGRRGRGRRRAGRVGPAAAARRAARAAGPPDEIAESRARPGRAGGPAAGARPRAARPAGGRPGQLGAVRDGAMGLAMVPVRRVVAAFPQLVREVATATGKDVRLVLEGEDVELDTRVLDGVADALKHLVTNAVDHGCETAAERPPAGKPAPATVRVAARAGRRHRRHRGRRRRRRHRRGRAARDRRPSAGCSRRTRAASGQALLSVLFVPGFSTRTVSHRDVRARRRPRRRTHRGRGPRRHGRGRDRSAGRHPLRITLPVTLGVMRCLVARRGRRAVRAAGHQRRRDPEPARRRGPDRRGRPRAGPPRRARSRSPTWAAPSACPAQRAARSAVVVRYGGAGEQLAWAVDALEGELELVVKDLGAFLGRLPALGGATIDSDGSVLLLLDLRELALAPAGPAGRDAGRCRRPSRRTPAAQTRPSPRWHAASPGASRRRAGGRGEPAAAGARGRGLGGRPRAAAGDPRGRRLRRRDRGRRHRRRGPAAQDPVDLVLSDVEMPGMDGFTLTRRSGGPAAGRTSPS